MPEMEPVYVWCQSSCQIPAKLMSASDWDTENRNGLNIWWWAWSALIILLSLIAAFTVYSLCLLLMFPPLRLSLAPLCHSVPTSCLNPTARPRFCWPPPSLHSLLKGNQAPDFDTAPLQGASIWLNPLKSVSFPPLSLLGAILKTIDDQMCPGKQLGWAQG